MTDEQTEGYELQFGTPSEEACGRFGRYPIKFGSEFEELLSRLEKERLEELGENPSQEKIMEYKRRLLMSAWGTYATII